MAEKLLFSLQNMGQMQRGSTKGRLLKSCQEAGTGQEVEALHEGIEMTILGVEITDRGEVEAEVGTAMRVTGIGMTIIGAEITGGEVGAEVGTAMRVISIEARDEITIIEAWDEITIIEAGAAVQVHMIEVIGGVVMMMKVQNMIEFVAGINAG